jgi:hypothetical protein
VESRIKLLLEAEMAIRDTGRRVKRATSLGEHCLSETFAHYRQRVVCNHEPDEDEPKPPKAKPIVSINGEDVDRKDERAA